MNRGPHEQITLAGLAGTMMSPPNAIYPATPAGRQHLAAKLTARGFIPTQGQWDFDRAKIQAMAFAMANGSFDWNRAALQPVILGPKGEVMGGHHRVVAAHLAGVDLEQISGFWPQVRRFPHNFRPEYHWADVLPDVV